MTNNLNLIPCPQNIIENPAADGCRLSELTVITFAGADDASEELLRSRFPKAAFKTETASGKYFLIFSDGSEIPSDNAEGTDGYVLSVGASGVRIDANTAAGLFYGIQTLIQLPDDAPAMLIQDSAAIPIRMLHWDLKGYLPKFEVLCDEMRALATYKANAILLELEDKYDYQCAPGIGVKGAYTYEQMREFSKLCASLHIRIVPKLQSIAHVDYILKQPAYADLRENGHIFQYCAMNPRVQELWENMAAELMEVFAEHADIDGKGYFHIGADEPGNLGECPECAKVGAAGSYEHKVGACIEFVLRNHWTPIMWDDIVRNAGGMFTPEEERDLRVRLGRDCVMMYWAYGYGGHRNEFPYLADYRNAGLNVWGASGYAGCDNWAGSVPPMEYRALNIDAWTKTAVENGLESVCATGWTRIGSADCPAEPQESAWFTILYAAESMWSGKAYDYREFLNNLYVRFFGTEPDERLIDTAMSIRKAPYEFADALAADSSEPARLRFFKIAAALESLAGKRDRLINYFQYYDGKLGNAMEDYRLSLLNRYTAEFAENLKTWKQAAYETYSEFYEEVTAEEIVRTRFGYLEKLVGEMRKLVADTREM